jgi:hypothetical protein
MENSPPSPLPPLETSAQMRATVHQSLAALGLDADHLLVCLEVLRDYRLCTTVDDLELGQHTRWIPLDHPEPGRAPLRTGGVLCRLTPTEDGGTVALCKTPQRRFFSVRVDCSMVYQRLSGDELLVRAAADLMSR